MSLAATPKRVKRGWMNLRVERIVHETHDSDTFYLVDADEGGRMFDYIAGQYLTFRFDDVEAKPLVRSYTMSSSPCQADFAAVTVKRVEGGKISNWLCDQVKVGSVLRARGPIGKFVYEPGIDRGHLIMVAGGSGVTPFVSILREYASHLGQAGAPQRMTLLVSHRSSQDILCGADLQPLIGQPGIAIHTTLSRENLEAAGYWYGRISDQKLAAAINGAYQTATFMTCGPQAIMDQTVAHLRGAGVEEAHIKTESFE
ncbi:MAG: FAD-binding oxidoreductase [Proteobacteria bacterium]|nr:FAD-binding oxidoreductase [Pseudomonadota bacterium]